MPTKHRLAGLLPGDPARVWEQTMALPAGAVTVLVRVRVPNPLPKGHPVRFPNATRDADRSGWLTLGKMTND